MLLTPNNVWWVYQLVHGTRPQHGPFARAPGWPFNLCRPRDRQPEPKTRTRHAGGTCLPARLPQALAHLCGAGDARWAVTRSMCDACGGRRCIGRNYAEHVRELGNEAQPAGEAPMIFLKAGSSVVPPGNIHLPGWSQDVHHEVGEREGGGVRLGA